MNARAIHRSMEKRPRPVGVVPVTIIYFVMGLITGLIGTDFRFPQIALRAAAISLLGLMAWLIHLWSTGDPSYAARHFLLAAFMSGKFVFAPGPLLQNFLVGLALTVFGTIVLALLARLCTFDKPDRTTEDPISVADLDGSNSGSVVGRTL